MREEKKSIFLLGGRAYPIIVEFFKFKEKTASIALKWKPPHRGGRDHPAAAIFRRVRVAPDDDREHGVPAG